MVSRYRWHIDNEHSRCDVDRQPVQVAHNHDSAGVVEKAVESRAN